MAQAVTMKGFRGTVQRAVTLPFRYGTSTARIRRCLDGIVALCDRWDLTPTIPVTMSVLERHPELVSSLKGVDVAVHGFQHLAYSGLTVAEQAEDLDAALDVVNKSRLAVRGFRAPYLRTDHNTLALLRSRGFLFDSSVPNYALPRGYRFASKLMELIRIRYGPVLERPIREPAGTGVVELPVSLPDDELLIDALGVRSPAALYRTFEAMLATAKARSSILVLQVHPERYYTYADALELVLQRATDEGAWKASLAEAAEWIRGGANSVHEWPRGHPYCLAITGDLDAAALGDFAPRIRWR